MAEAGIEAVMKAVHNPAYIYLRQHLTLEGVNISEPSAEIPVGWELLYRLLEKKRKTEVKELITMAFDHPLEAHVHMSSFAANMSSLAKIVDPDTFKAVLKAMSQPLIQVNIPDCFLNLLTEPQWKTTAEECLAKLQRFYCHAWTQLVW